MKKFNISKILIVFSICCILMIGVESYYFFNNKNDNIESVFIMGGTFYNECTRCEEEDNQDTVVLEIERYTRPSTLPILNNKYACDYSVENTPDNLIITYYSILRDAANIVEDKYTGCGSIGSGKIPYPISYEYLTKQYQEELSYEAYLKTFENILHINLIKYHQVPNREGVTDCLRYFVELETIEGTSTGTGVFAYYYGFIDIQLEEEAYKINHMEYYPESYLCAPWHGWNYDALTNVEIRYGERAGMIQKIDEVSQKEYIINVPFLSKENVEYKIVFFRLTNGTDIEVAQYQKNKDEKWELIYLNPTKKD